MPRVGPALHEAFIYKCGLALRPEAMRAERRTVQAWCARAGGVPRGGPRLLTAKTGVLSPEGPKAPAEEP